MAVRLNILLIMVPRQIVGHELIKAILTNKVYFLSKNKQKTGLTVMLREERKWDHIECSLITTKGKKRMEDKNRNKNRAISS